MQPGGRSTLGVRTHRQLAIPAEQVLANRMIWMISGVLARLEAEADLEVDRA